MIHSGKRKFDNIKNGKIWVILKYGKGISKLKNAAYFFFDHARYYNTIFFRFFVAVELANLGALLNTFVYHWQ